MKHFLFLATFFCLTCFKVTGQYSFHKVFKNTQEGLSDDMDAEPSITRFNKGQAWYLNYTLGSQGINIVLNRYDLQRNHSAPTIHFKSNYTEYVQDFYVPGNEMYYLAGNQLFYHHLKTNFDTSYTAPLAVTYDKIYTLDDEHLLLSHVYNHHPADGKPGIYLAVFHRPSQSYRDSLYLPFSCIGMSHLVSQWIGIQGSNIFIIDPLTGELSTYNKNLQNTDRKQLQVFEDSTLKQNLLFRQFINAGIVERHTRFAQVLKKYPIDSLTKNPGLWDHSTGSKGYIKWLSDTLRKQYTYIEKLWVMDSVTLAITVVQPGRYEEDQVLMTFTKGNPVPEKSITWRVKPKSVLEKPEDYFVVDLRNTIYEPFFYEGKVYAWQQYPVSLFEAGSKTDLDRKLLKNNFRKNIKLQLTSYTYP